MAYNYQNFLRPITTTDRNIQILDTAGVVKYTLNPFSIINVMASNNILRVNVKGGRVIIIGFSTANEAKLALDKIQTQIDELTVKVPYNVDKSVENYITEQIGDISVVNAPTFSINSPITVVDGHFIPAVDGAYDLGTASSQWRSLYVSNDTVYIGGFTISLEDGYYFVVGLD